MELEKDLVAASATPLVLAILSEGESYGYAIIKRVAELSKGEMQWTDGMVYPLLHRLERNGFVEAVWGASETGRRRKYYRLTKAGTDHLDRQRRQWQMVDLALRGIWRGILMIAVDTPVAIALMIFSKQEGTLCLTM
jgi:DNA-binding PadR family transcriptional regulator